MSVSNFTPLLPLLPSSNSAVWYLGSPQCCEHFVYFAIDFTLFISYS